VLAVSAPPLYQARRADQSPLYQLLLDHYERFEGVYEDRFSDRLGEWRAVVGKVFRSFLDCGILAHGFLRVVCRTCHDEILVPWSCKRQLCPSCGQRRSQEFADFLPAVTGGTPWAHVVFTLPKLLRPTFLRERRLLRELSRCAWKTLKQGLRAALGQPDAEPAAVISKASAGDLGNPNPHLHCVVAHGAWVEDRFVEWPPRLTAERLEELFRRRVLAMLVKQQRLTEDTMEKLRAWQHSGFSVFIGDPIGEEATGSRARLARYIVKPPVALERLSYDAATCQVTYVSVKRGEQKTFTALDFIAQLSVHIPDFREHTVTWHGRWSNRSRGNRKSLALSPEEQPQPASEDVPLAPPGRKAFRMAWAELLARVWEADVLTCSRCGGERRIIAAITKPMLICRILQHLGLSSLPRAPDPHLCEDRDPVVRARHPLFVETLESESLESESPSDQNEWPGDPDPGWPMDDPHPED